MVMSCRDFCLALALLYTFDMAWLALQHNKLFWSRGLSICCVVELASWLFSFFLVFSLRFFGCGRRWETRFGFFCVAAAGRLQTEVSHTDRDFSLAVAVLHAFDVASLPLQHQKAKGGGLSHAFDGVARAVTSKGRGGLSLSSAKRLLCGSTGDFVVSCFFFFWGGGFLSQVLCVAAVDGRHTSSSSASRRKSLADRHLSLTQIATSPLHSLFCTQSTCTSLAL